MRSFGDGLMKYGAPNMGIGVVDVRNLAVAHLKAARLPTALGRYIISGHNTSFLDIGKQLLPEYESYPVPINALPKALIWLVGPLMNKNLTRKFVCNNVNYLESK
ncbi:uncharacterized protein PRCAT00002508001 [Priceomyces carsonii]|uniref:uncharacterized protein n=1 Tax=Priceomyces carsonii TaxID=28549 RepID=UPI002ED8AF2E|nr:unnamed protein product [Priceomyces carsonii]